MSAPPRLLQVNRQWADGRSWRYYQSADGTQAFPAVSTVLSHTKPASAAIPLRRWRQKLWAQGLCPEEASKAACERGRKVHRYLERHLLGEPFEQLVLEAELEGVAGWLRSAEWLLQCIEEVIGTEQAFCSQMFWYAGTLDAQLRLRAPQTEGAGIEGQAKRRLLVDWKTTAAPMTTGQLQQRCSEYLTQLAAYLGMLQEWLPNAPQSALVVMLNPETPAATMGLVGAALERHRQDWHDRLEQFQLAEGRMLRERTPLVSYGSVK